MRRLALAVSMGCAALWVGHAEASSLTVMPSAATIGAFGLEITVGSTCSGPDLLILGSADSPAQGSYQGCQEVSASDLAVSGPGAVFVAGTRVVVGNGFSVQGGAPFEIRLDSLLATGFAWIDDPSPIAEEVYNARFYVRSDDLSLAGADEISHFVAYSSSGAVEFRLVLEPDSGGPGHVFTLEARENGGTYSSTAPGQEIPLAAGWNKVEVEWSNGLGDGRLEISINDGPFSGLSSLTNDASLIESIEWGAVDGTLTTTSGTVQLDGFDSWR